MYTEVSNSVGHPSWPEPKDMLEGFCLFKNTAAQPTYIDKLHFHSTVSLGVLENQQISKQNMYFRCLGKKKKVAHCLKTTLQINLCFTCRLMKQLNEERSLWAL